MRIAIVANPNALRFDKEQLNIIYLFLVANGADVDLFFTGKQGDGTVITDKISGMYDVVAAYGGDGIINEVVNGDMRSAALGVLPAGTTNVLAIDLGIGTDPLRAAKVLLRGKRKRAYPGVVNGRRFMLMVGVGFDGASVGLVRDGLKRRCGKLAYVVAGVEAYLKEKLPVFDVKIGKRSIKADWVIVSKIKRYAGHFRISNSVDITERAFDVCIFKPLGFRLIEQPLHNALLFTNVHLLATPFVEHIITDEEIQISGGPVQVDGDYAGDKEVRIRLQNEPIDIIVP